MTTGNQAYQKSMNTALIMRAIRERPGISRTEVAARTGLTKSTVTNLARELLGDGLVREDSAEGPRSTGGRPRIGLRIHAEELHVAGIDARPEEYRMVIADLAGTVLARGSHSVRTEGRGTLGPAAVLTHATERVATFRKESGVPGILLGVGLAVPARVDPVRGTIVESQSFELENTSVRSVTALPTTVPLLIENDANAVAWGALCESGIGRISTLLAVTARIVSDTPTESPSGQNRVAALRVGTGIVLNGSVHHGHDFGAGEFHSAPWKLGSPGETSGEPWRPGTPHNSTGKGIESAYEAVGELLESLSVPVSMLRPQALVYAGDLIRHRHVVESLLRDELSGRYIDPRVSGVPLRPAREGEWAGAIGAAQMFIERLFAVPSVGLTRPRELPEWTELRPGRVAWTA